MFTDNVKFFQKAIILHPEEDKFLILKRHDDDSRNPGYWDLPGGNVDFGENHLVAIEREIREETGLTVTTPQVIEVVTRFDQASAIYTFFIGYQCQAYYEQIKPTEQLPQIRLSTEHTTYKWVNKSEFLALEASSLLKKLVDKRLSLA